MISVNLVMPLFCSAKPANLHSRWAKTLMTLDSVMNGKMKTRMKAKRNVKRNKCWR
jgi:hypothetical protein